MTALMVSNPNARLEAFCDGVFAIALTLLIIDVRLPMTADIQTSGDLWRGLAHLSPSVFAFLLSFGIIFITWVNHHGALKLVDRSTPAFIYANGFMLLTVVFTPFPTMLLGEHLLSGHAAPAVILYSTTFALQAVAWWLLSRTALAGEPLTRNAGAASQMRRVHRDAYFGFAFYAACAIVAIWLPLTAAIAITVMWTVWLMHSLYFKTD